MVRIFISMWVIFYRANCTRLIDLIHKIYNKELPKIPKYLSNECKNFIKRCLQYDENKRPSAKDMLLDPFIVGSNKSNKSNK